MANINLTVDNKSLLKALVGIGTAFSNFTPAFRNIGDALLTSHDNRFQKNQSPNGSKWVDNADATYLAYAYYKTRGSRSKTKTRGTKNVGLSKAIGSKEVLRWDYTLLSHLSYRAYPQYLKFNTPTQSAKYAAAVQFGVNKAGRPRIPARPYLGTTAKDEQNIADEIISHILEAIKNA